MSEFLDPNENFETKPGKVEATPEQAARLFYRAVDFVQPTGDIVMKQGMPIPYHILELSGDALRELGFKPGSEGHLEYQDAHEIREPNGGEVVDFLPPTLSLVVREDAGGGKKRLYMETFWEQQANEFTYEVTDEKINAKEDSAEIAEVHPPHPEELAYAREVLDSVNYDEKIVSRWPDEQRIKDLDDVLRGEAKRKGFDYPDDQIVL